MKPTICINENVKSYSEGKRDFSVSELNDIKLYLLKYKDQLEVLKISNNNLRLS